MSIVLHYWRYVNKSIFRELGLSGMSIATRARRDGDHHVLNGSKTFTSNGRLRVPAGANEAVKELIARSL